MYSVGTSERSTSPPRRSWSHAASVGMRLAAVSGGSRRVGREVVEEQADVRDAEREQRRELLCERGAVGR